MQQQTRTDIHRPSLLNPQEYQFVAFGYMKINSFGDCKAVLYQRELLKQHMAMTGGAPATHLHGGNCMVCGAHAICTAWFYHKYSNEYVRTGLDCADKMEMGDAAAFKKQIANHRLAVAGKRKAKQLLIDNGIERAWFYFENGDLFSNSVEFAERTIVDITRRLVQYGKISDPQIELVKKLLVDIEERPAKEAAKKAQKALDEANTPDVPEGRYEIKGTVLTTKLQDSQYGSTLKMLVKDDRGFKLWGSIPSSIDQINKGDLVAFFATVERSKEDPKFGYFKRPTKATFTYGPQA